MGNGNNGSEQFGVKMINIMYVYCVYCAICKLYGFSVKIIICFY